MKKVKICLTVIIAIIILAISSQVYAYGSQVDTANAITMPSNLSNGTGSVSSSISGAMSYQFVEISSSKYATIKKYEAIYTLIKAYMNGDSNYDTLATNYETTYNQTANGIMSEYGIQFNEEGYNAIRGLWITELTTYDASAWVDASGNTISIDLTTFEGTKYYIAWVKIGDTYDAEVYQVTGTGSNNNGNGSNTENENNNNSTNGTNTSTTNGTTSAKGDTTTAKQTTLPKTGINSYILLVLVAMFIVTGTVSYVKYRKIK